MLPTLRPLGNSKPTTSLLLFALLVNFFQYVKELSIPGTSPYLL